jgi:hypothetical protein
MAIIDKPRTDIDSRFRSLLQKAVRRGNEDLVFTTSAYLESLTGREKNWFRNRTAVITFEECWPLGASLVFNKRFHSKVAALVIVTRAAKVRDATGLGYLAYALAAGDGTVLGNSAHDRDVRIVADAIRRPDDFYRWLETLDSDTRRRQIIQNAVNFRQAGRPRDRAVIQAGAYLAATAPMPAVGEGPAAADAAFPYWIALDMHTAQGRRVLKDVARDLHIVLPQLEWCMYYYEGAVASRPLVSVWWERYCRWYFRRIGLPPEEAALLWEPVRPQVVAALEEESRQLHRELYAWKMENRERVDYLRKTVALYIEHFEGGGPDQRDLF